mmetsp:Transcript_5318/g.13452  ORF Transcript_5318/g.13452 Transcript_5318/m.13452 type:complete len:263 (+) Transcript_5318:3588-4376(+)
MVDILSSSCCWKLSVSVPMACFLNITHASAMSSLLISSSSSTPRGSDSSRSVLASASYFLSASLSACWHLLSQMYDHAFWIDGTDPVLIDCVYACARFTRATPSRAVPFMRLGSHLERMSLRKSPICSWNSGRSFEAGIPSSFCSSDSSVTGRTMVKQSLSGKKWVSMRRILFLASICSVKPGAGWRARSRYSFDVNACPSGVTSWRVKSRTSQRKEGKYWAKSAPSSSPPCAELLTWMCLVRFTTSERLLSAPSSMDPTEL